jgi:hypothetical protein
VFSVNCGPDASLRPPSRKKKIKKELRKSREESKSEYRIQDGGLQVPGYQTFWTIKHSTLNSEYLTLVQQYPEADAQLNQLLKMLDDIEDVPRHIPTSAGESAKWDTFVNAAEGNGASYCKGLHGKPLFSALYSTYTVSLHELKAVLKASTLAGQTNPPKTTRQQTTQGGGVVS